LKKRLQHPHPVLRVTRLIAGLTLVVIGVVGLALPVIPQWPFLIPGLLLLAPESRWARKLVIWLRTRLRLRKMRKLRRTGSAAGGAPQGAEKPTRAGAARLPRKEER
jgi:uncharacterized membrane protein YbaN (DUF454 family)